MPFDQDAYLARIGLDAAPSPGLDSQKKTAVKDVYAWLRTPRCESRRASAVNGTTPRGPGQLNVKTQGDENTPGRFVS